MRSWIPAGVLLLAGCVGENPSGTSEKTGATTFPSAYLLEGSEIPSGWRLADPEGISGMDQNPGVLTREDREELFPFLVPANGSWLQLLVPDSATRPTEDSIVWILTSAWEDAEEFSEYMDGMRDAIERDGCEGAIDNWFGSETVVWEGTNVVTFGFWQDLSREQVEPVIAAFEQHAPVVERLCP